MNVLAINAVWGEAERDSDAMDIILSTRVELEEWKRQERFPLLSFASCIREG